MFPNSLTNSVSLDFSCSSHSAHICLISDFARCRLSGFDMDSATFQRAKCAIESIWSCRSEFSTRIQDCRATFTSALAINNHRSLFVALESLPVVRPLVTRLFVDSWDNTDASWAHYVDAVDQLVRFSTRNLELNDLTVLCRDELCDCPLSLGPVGDRGGIIRRTPCRRLDFLSKIPYEMIIFQQVSLKF
jgi:hypothetical protein